MFIRRNGVRRHSLRYVIEYQNQIASVMVE